MRFCENDGTGRSGDKKTGKLLLAKAVWKGMRLKQDKETGKFFEWIEGPVKMKGEDEDRPRNRDNFRV